MSFGYQVLGFGSGGNGVTEYNVEYLVVAGGGGGGMGTGAGAGAGGMLTTFPGGTAVVIEEGTQYTMTIGDGGVGSLGPDPASKTRGDDTIAFDGASIAVPTTGGGFGGGLMQIGGIPNPDNPTYGQPGGSGGGGAQQGYTGGIGVVGQGNDGGTQPTGNPGPANAGSGGGGKNAAGAGAGASGGGGAGGAGAENLIAPAYPLGTYFAGGAGGGDYPPEGGPGAGGIGGGGTGGGPVNATPGIDGLGGGGGGGAAGFGPVSHTTESGMDGGNGVIIIRSPSDVAFTVAPPTNTTATHPGGDKIATFTVTGTLDATDA